MNKKSRFCVWRVLFMMLSVAGGWLANQAVASAYAGNDSLPFVSPIFGDHMVLQRGKPNTIWGWTDPGTEVRIAVGGKEARTQADESGKWRAKIQPPKAGGPYTLTIDGPQHVEWTDVLVGDVWLCGGQSNMEIGLGEVQHGEEEIKTAKHPNIRLFMVDHRIAYAPVEVPQGEWKVCSPETVGAGGWGGFSAVGYFFGRRLQQEVDVPIGLVHDCWGGTPAESWASAESLGPLKDFDSAIAAEKRYLNRGDPQHGIYLSHWYDEYDVGQQDNAWFAPDFDDRDWKSVILSDAFRKLGVPEKDALCYFRKTVLLPDPLPAGDARIQLGKIEKLDTTKVNGEWVGADCWEGNARNYKVAHGILKPGENVVVVRVFKTTPEGGFLSDPEEMKLVLGDGSLIPLAGEWRGRVSVDARPPHPLPFGYETWPNMPVVLYNGMIAPVAPLAITGAIWYQGEANVGRPEQYQTLLPTMIADWRRAFGQGDFPFYIVSLAAFMPHRDMPGDDAWAELREAQDIVAHSVRNSGLAVTIDIGDTHDIHPRNKKDVGERLAMQALAKHYGKHIPCSGPRFVSAEPLSGGAIQLYFDHTDGGLVVKGDQLGEFAIAGDDGNWFWAEARVIGETVVVSSSEVLKPMYVRYAWQANPKATLFNGAGFPAIPFRTDNRQ